MAETLQFELVSPERRLASVAATEVRIPGAEGDFTAMPGHAPFMTTLRPGLVLVRAADGAFTCLDAKFSFDDAAEPRQKELFALRDREDVQDDQSTEMEAKQYDLVYIRLDGNIGNVVNGTFRIWVSPTIGMLCMLVLD